MTSSSSSFDPKQLCRIRTSRGVLYFYVEPEGLRFIHHEELFQPFAKCEISLEETNTGWWLQLKPPGKEEMVFEYPMDLVKEVNPIDIELPRDDNSSP